MTKKNIIIFPLEKIDARYTKQWYDNIPAVIRNEVKDRYHVIQIDGVQKNTSTTSGAFLNFSDTNFWKSSQMCNFLELYDSGVITPDDRFLFTDFWNPVILQIAYMRDLLDQRWELHGIVHAGAYDPTDILGMKMKKPWPHYAEQAMFYALNYSYFATNFHLNLFVKNLRISPEFQDRCIRSGQPHELIIDELEALSTTPKRNRVIWPHRCNSDKQPAIAEDLQVELGYPIVMTQRMSLTKQEYYKTMAKCKVMFSCSLHENLGISQMEGCLAGVLPCVPDRASYSEMYLDTFKYPSEWTSSLANYKIHRKDLMNFVFNLMENYSHLQPVLSQQCEILKKKYLTSHIMMEQLTK